MVVNGLAFGKECYQFQRNSPFFLLIESKCVRYYYSHNEPMNAAIVLSDFTSDGWKMSQSLGNLSIDHILSAGKPL